MHGREIIRHDDKSYVRLLCELGHGLLDIGWRANRFRNGLGAKSRSSLLKRIRIEQAAHRERIGIEPKTLGAELGHDLLENREHPPADAGIEDRKAGRIGAW